MGSALELIRSFRRSDTAQRRDERTVLPDGLAWVVFAVSVVCRSLLSTGVALLLWSIVPNFVGLQSTVVMSGSMTPSLQVGDAVVVRKLQTEQLTPGQILLFDDPDEAGRLRMHRLVSMGENGIVTKGDANQSADTSHVGFDAVRGAGFLRIPFAGLPELWIRTGQVMPLVGSGAAAVLLLGGVRLGRLLEDPAERQRGRHRGVKLPPRRRAVTTGVVILALAGPVVPLHPGSASAGYAATARPPASTWRLCGDRARDSQLPAPRFAWGYSAATSTDTAVPDASTISGATVSPGTDPGTASGAFTRQTTCTGTSSPYISLGPTRGTIVEAGGTSSRSAAVTVASWFRTSSTSGVIAAFSDGTGTSAGSSVDRALYVNSDGKVAFSNLATLGLWTCTGATTVTTTGVAWHLAVATWSPATGCKLWVDGNPAVTNAPALGAIATPSAFAGRWRVGYERTAGLLGLGSADYAFVGDLDETRVWDSVLSDAQVATVLSRTR